MSRSEQELDILERISQILGGGLELSEVFQRAMSLLSERLNIQRAALVVLDRSSDQLRTIASVGLTPAEQQRGTYAVGEGVTGQVLATGEPAVIPDIAEHPEFLNRTGARKLTDTPDGSPAAAPQAANPNSRPLSFIGVPVSDGEQYVGVAQRR